MRISRPCYDKYWRCPGWAGGGMSYAKITKCNSGSLARTIDWTSHWKWKAHQCPDCGVWVLPSVTRWLDPTWIFWRIKYHTKYAVGDFLHWWRER